MRTGSNDIAFKVINDHRTFHLGWVEFKPLMCKKVPHKFYIERILEIKCFLPEIGIFKSHNINFGSIINWQLATCGWLDRAETVIVFQNQKQLVTGGWFASASGDWLLATGYECATQIVLYSKTCQKVQTCPGLSLTYSL
jgi:hypothetical protein